MYFSLLLDDGKTKIDLPVRQGRRRKSMALKFESNRPVIEVPKHLRNAQVEKLLSTNHGWIRRAYRKWQMSEPEIDSGAQNQVEDYDFGHQVGVAFCDAIGSKTGLEDYEHSLNPIEFAGKKLPVSFRHQMIDTGRSKKPKNSFVFSFNAKHWRSFKTAFEKHWQSHENNAIGQSSTITNDKEQLNIEAFLSECKQVFWHAAWLIELQPNNSDSMIISTPDIDEWLSFVQENSAQMKFSVSVCLKDRSDLVDLLSPIHTRYLLDSKFNGLLNWVLNWVLSYLFGELYKNCLTGYLQFNLPRIAKTMKLQFREFEVRSYKSRWGSCKSDQSLQFNWRICQANLSVIDSLIIHELAHLKHPNHSAHFWKLVKCYDSHFFESERLLKTSGKRWIQFLNIAYR